MSGMFRRDLKHKCQQRDRDLAWEEKGMEEELANCYECLTLRFDTRSAVSNSVN